MANKTINRGKLFRDIDKGLYEGQLGFNISRDGEYPDRYGDKTSAWRPVRIRRGYEDVKEDSINLWDWGFKSKSGRAYKDESNIIGYGSNSNEFFRLRRRKR